jgi:Ca-activated chloride channel family protein
MMQQLEDILFHFHFIHPHWFWGLISVVLILALVILANRENNKWQKRIAPHLRSTMFLKGSKRALWLPIAAFILACGALLIALAGPTWKMKDIPQGKASAVMLIAMDNSHSMLADDISPNRLERVKLKIQDLLDANPETDVGLFAYAGTPHIVVPFCNDYGIIKHHIESLNPRMMPVRGSNIPLAIHLADSLLKRYEAPSTLVLFTDNLSPNDANTIEQFSDNSIHQVWILPLGTEKGGQMPGFNRQKVLKDKQGAVRLARVDQAVFNRLNNHPKINVQPLTLDKSDMEQLAQEVRRNKSFTLSDELDDEEWDNKGWWLILPALLLILSWFRKGWSLFWLWTGVLIIQSCTPDQKHADWWYNADYKAQYLMQDSAFTEAAETFESLPHKAMAYFKAGNYDAALEIYSLDSTFNGQYNKALTLVRLGRFDEARQTFEKVIELNPNDDLVKESLHELDQRIKANDSLNRQNQPLKELETKKEEPLEERKAKGKDEELTSDTEVDELPKDGKRVTDEMETGISKAEELEKPEDAPQEEGRQEDAKNVMLKKISADPAEFLRRRFKFQHEKYYKDVKETNDI